MSSLIPRNLPDPGPGDVILLQNLQLPHGVVDRNCWGEAKEQPALVSVKLWLRDGFGSTAGSDALDQTTIHYGQLAKRIRASNGANQTVVELFEAVYGSVEGMVLQGE